MDSVDGVAGVDGQLLDLLVVVRVCAVVIAVGPELELGVGMEALRQDRNGAQGLDKGGNVGGLHLGEGLVAREDVSAGVGAYSGLLKHHLKHENHRPCFARSSSSRADSGLREAFKCFNV